MHTDLSILLKASFAISAMKLNIQRTALPTELNALGFDLPNALDLLVSCVVLRITSSTLAALLT
jgi:hypothetical protein